MFLAGCVTTQPTPGPLTPTPGASQYQLTGHYSKDKFYFFPNGRDFKKEHIFLQALLEGAEGELYKPKGTFSAEQNLAIEYDVAALVVKTSDDGLETYGIVLGKVGRWNESMEAFKKACGINKNAAGMWGNLGVAQHAIGNYGESAKSFEQATVIAPSYFNSRPNQKMVWQASKNGRTVTP
jgi:tetratricopeptide (TPR) repeat protein